MEQWIRLILQIDSKVAAEPASECDLEAILAANHTMKNSPTRVSAHARANAHNIMIGANLVPGRPARFLMVQRSN